MAVVSVTINDAVLSRVLDAIASEYHYNPATDGTKAAFAKVQVIEFLKRTVKEAEGSAAMKTAQDSAVSNVDTNIVIT